METNDLCIPYGLAVLLTFQHMVRDQPLIQQEGESVRIRINCILVVMAEVLYGYQEP